MRRLRALLPSADRLAAVRGLRWLKPLLVGAALIALALAAAAWLAVEALWRLAALRRAARWSSIRNAKGEIS
jgi:hypothetical protein